MAAMVDGHPRRQHHHLVARAEHAPRHLAGVGPVVVVLVGQRPHHVLHREAAVDQVAVRRDVQLLQVHQQGQAPVPGHVLGPVDDVVAEQGAHREEAQVGDLQAGGEGPELVPDGLVDPLVPVDQVHLVDAHRHVGHPQQGGQEGVAAGLLEQALAGVDQHQGHVGGRRPGDHVAGVLHVARACRPG